jgi:hypothetical protein
MTTQSRGTAEQTHRAWRFGALFASALLVAAFLAACGPGAQSTDPTGGQGPTNTATASASLPDSASPSSAASETLTSSPSESPQPSAVVAGSPNAVQTDLSNLDQLLNGLDNSLSQAGPSASGE